MILKNGHNTDGDNAKNKSLATINATLCNKLNALSHIGKIIYH